jgi:hypothetical protein
VSECLLKIEFYHEGALARVDEVRDGTVKHVVLNGSFLGGNAIVDRRFWRPGQVVDTADFGGVLASSSS